MSDHSLPDIGGLQIDPGMLAELSRTAVANQAALTARQKRDRRRITLRIDLPGRWLKKRLAHAAAGLDVSQSHLASFLLAWALARLLDRDADLLRLIDENRYEYRSLNAGHGLDADCLAEVPALSLVEAPDQLENPAEVPDGRL